MIATNVSVVNATYENAISPAAMGTLTLTLGVMTGLVLMLFLLFKFFRRFLRGGVVVSSLWGLYAVSNWISKQAIVNGDLNPLKFVGKVGAFIVISVIVGALIGRSKKVKAVGEKMKTEEMEKLFEEELKKQKDATEDALKLKSELTHVVEELKLQARAVTTLQQDVFVMRKVLEQLFKVLKERGFVEGRFVMGMWVK
jgi:hypothetical protein